MSPGKQKCTTWNRKQLADVEIEWKTYWVSPVEIEFLEMEIR